MVNRLVQGWCNRQRLVHFEEESMKTGVLTPYLGQDARNPRVAAAHNHFARAFLRAARAGQTYTQWRDSLRRRESKKVAA